MRFGLDYALLQVANISQLQSYRRKQLRSQTEQKSDVSHSFLSHSVEDIRWVLDNFQPELARFACLHCMYGTLSTPARGQIRVSSALHHVAHSQAERLAGRGDGAHYRRHYEQHLQPQLHHKLPCHPQLERSMG